MTVDTPRRVALLMAAVSMIVLAFTAAGLPIVWDEGEYLDRADRILTWLSLLTHFGNPRGGLHALSQSVIREHWLFITWSEGHPAWAIIPIAVSKALLGGVLHPLTAARLGTVAVFSIACGVIAFRLRKLYGTVAAVVAVIALLTFPRIFSEAHFATLDGQLTAWWMMLWAVDASQRSGVGSTIGIGVLAGLTSATKFTGWLGWIPLIAWRALCGDRRRRLALLLILPIGLLTFCIVNPPLWHHPLDGLITHFRLSLDRANTFNIRIAFLGRVYDTQHPLPWYNTLAWLVLVTPPPLLVLGSIGLIRCLRMRDAASVSLLLCWATLMVARALPGAPPHDGIRLFLPAFGFWCIFAGIGAQRAWDVSRRQSPVWRGALVRATVVLALAADAVSLARYFPQTLSHYSVLVGGVRGAASLGMEPTYWWDSLDNDALSWINEHTAPTETIAFSRPANISYLHDWNRLLPYDVDPTRDVFKWYVLQNRTGFLEEADRLLMKTVKPAYTKFAGRRSADSGVALDLNVPLLMIFTYDEYQAAVAFTR